MQYLCEEDYKTTRLHDYIVGHPSYQRSTREPSSQEREREHIRGRCPGTLGVGVETPTLGPSPQGRIIGKYVAGPQAQGLRAVRVRRCVLELGNLRK